MSEWVCFGLGLNVYAAGRMRIADIIRRLDADADLRVVAWYGATGNVLVASDLSGHEVASRVGRFTTPRPWTAVPLEQVVQNVEEIRATPPPPPEPGVRWTRGIAFPIEAPNASNLTDTYRATLRWTRDRERSSS